MGEVTPIWQQVTNQIYNEFDLLASQSGEIAEAINTIVATATTPIEAPVDNYAISATSSLASRLVRPEDESSGRRTGGSSSSNRNKYVDYEGPEDYEWFTPQDNEYYEPHYVNAPRFEGNEPVFPTFPEPSVDVRGVGTGEPPSFLGFPVFTEQTGATPTEPTLRDITLPDAPTVTIPAFSATKPNLQLDNLSVDLDFSDRAYSSALLGALQATSGLWLNGQHALTTTLWSALQTAAEARARAIGVHVQNWARDSWRAAGWPEFDQILDLRAEEAQQVNQNTQLNMRRDAEIHKATLLVASMRAAIQTGVALEQVLLSQWDQANQRLLESAIALVEFANATLQLRIKEFEAQSKIYTAESVVLRAQIEAESEKLVLSKAEIDAEILRGQIDQDKIEAYEAQRLAIDIAVSNYEAKQQAWIAQEAQNEAINERFRGVVDAYEQAIAQYTSQWKIYQIQLKQLAAHPEFENTLIRAFAQRIQAASTEIDGEQKKVGTQLESIESKLERMQVNLLKQRADVRNALNTLTADMAEEQIKLQRQRATSAYTKAYNQAEDTKPRLAALDNNEQLQNIYQRLRIAEQKHELAAQQGAIALNTATRAYAQLGSASFSAINVSMEASGALSHSWAWDTVYNTEG